MKFRIGHGYDIHRVVTGRPLVLGGVTFDTDFGLEGHSDADCLTHAICDALLGAAGLPDIGVFFPNTDTSFINISSQILLQRVGSELGKLGWRAANIDATLIAEKPKIYPRLGDIKAVLSKTTNLPISCIGIKATTNEKMGFLGRGEGIAAMAVASVALEE